MSRVKGREMAKQELARMKRRVKTLQKQLGELGPVMRGTVVVIGTRNKQPYFSLNKNKKTQLIYLGKKREAKAREYSDNYQTLREIVEEMTQLNMELLKNSYGL
jgi:ribosomal protein S12